jgi:hypothetical protein
VPAVRRWAARKACQAYHHGFIRGLAQDPKAIVLAVVNHEGSGGNRRAEPAVPLAGIIKN